MSLNKLLHVMPAPEAPVDLGTEADWEELERSIGLALPRDYKEFVSAFGTGSISNAVFILNPFSHTESRDFLQRLFHLESYTLSRAGTQMSGTGEKYKCFPYLPGLIPWANDREGNEYFWLADGSPSDWPVVFKSWTGSFWQFDFGMTRFLEQFIKGGLDKHLKANLDELRFKIKGSLEFIPYRAPFVTPLEYMNAKRKPKISFKPDEEA